MGPVRVIVNSIRRSSKFIYGNEVLNPGLRRLEFREDTSLGDYTKGVEEYTLLILLLPGSEDT